MAVAHVLLVKNVIVSPGKTVMPLFVVVAVHAPPLRLYHLLPKAFVICMPAVVVAAHLSITFSVNALEVVVQVSARLTVKFCVPGVIG